MQDQDKTKEQLISELNELRRRTAPLIDSHNKISATEDASHDKNCWEMYRELVDCTNSIILRWNSDGKITFILTFRAPEGYFVRIFPCPILGTVKELNS